MKSSALSTNKKVLKKRSSKNSFTSGVKLPIKKMTVPLAKIVTRNSTPTIRKKLKRYAKQGFKSLLLAPSFHVAVKVCSAVLLVSSLLYASYFFIGKTFANEVVISQSEIVARVGRLTTLPEGLPDEIVRVQDGEDLRKQNSFYKDIEEGNYILMYKDTAVIYDLRADRVVGVKRVDDKVR